MFYYVKEFAYDENDVQNNAFAIIISVKQDWENYYCFVENNSQKDMYVLTRFTGTSVSLENNKLQHKCNL